MLQINNGPEPDASAYWRERSEAAERRADEWVAHFHTCRAMLAFVVGAMEMVPVTDEDTLKDVNRVLEKARAYLDGRK
jgi:2-phosphoglycerate kinase